MMDQLYERVSKRIAEVHEEEPFEFEAWLTNEVFLPEMNRVISSTATLAAMDSHLADIEKETLESVNKMELSIKELEPKHKTSMKKFKKKLEQAEAKAQTKKRKSYECTDPTCPDYTKKFKSEHVLRMHRDQDHNSIYWLCYRDKCNGKKFSCKAALKTHIKGTHKEDIADPEPVIVKKLAQPATTT